MRVYGLLGKTLKHSFSKAFFTEKFLKEGLDATHRYENFELADISDLEKLLWEQTNLKGLNVTIPYKESVIPFLHYKNEVVAANGACNCIKIRDGKLYGYNTDVVGFRKSLEKGLKPHHAKALVLGTGGAAKAVLYVLAQLGIEAQIVSRSKSANAITYDEVNKEVLLAHPLVINTSPVGMFPHINDAPDLPYEAITTKHFLFDLIYNPEQTQFLKKGAERGALTANGHEMLIEQALESWRIWSEP